MKEKESSQCCKKSVILNLFQDLVVHKGFTLLEVIVAIIIIGALLAFALPKYETALDKSRFSTLMPLTKSIKDAEEVFYIASNQYTEDVSSLDVKVNPGETVQVSVKDDDDYSYVQAIDPRIDNIYKAYLKHSTNFPEERHCEALTDSTRAKKVCETLGGTLLDESGEYTVYVLEGTGQGSVNTEKQCEGEPPSTEQACSSGCGTQTRSVSCDTSTGEWDLGDWTGTCPEQGETTQSCTNGVGTETRTFSCSGNTWVAGEWDKSSCTCDPEEKPAATQTCTTGVGTETRSVSCNGTTWETGSWDTSSCTCDPETKPSASEACTYGGTKTRTVTCNADTLTWEAEETWDESACECDPSTEPSTAQTCSSGCGSQTRTNTCVNGAWVEGEWQGTCKTKPSTSAACTSGSGTMTRTATCNKNGTWTAGSWDMSSCTCTGTKPSTSTSCSDGCQTGTKTRSVTCVNGAWQTGSYGSCSVTKPSTTTTCQIALEQPWNVCYDGYAQRTVTCSNGAWSLGTWDSSQCVYTQTMDPNGNEDCPF